MGKVTCIPGVGRQTVARNRLWVDLELDLAPNISRSCYPSDQRVTGHDAQRIKEKYARQLSANKPCQQRSEHHNNNVVISELFKNAWTAWGRRAWLKRTLAGRDPRQMETAKECEALTADTPGGVAASERTWEGMT